MTRKNRSLTKYIETYSVGDRWPLVCNVRRNVDNIVVIPALAESLHLFRTLESLAKNPASELARTLVICVVNNRAASSLEAIDDNQRTLTILSSLLHDSDVDMSEANHFLTPIIRTIVKSGINVGYVDASSPGCEMDDRDGGVGLARKIGFDRALELFDYGKEGVNLLFSLDADTLVKDNYLSAVRDYFEKTGS